MKRKVTKEQKVEYFKKVDRNIREYGCHITTVLEDRDTTPFGYSTGLFQNFNIPELFISGLPSGLTNEIINDYSKKYRFDKVPLLKVINNLTERFPVYFIEIKNEKIKDYVLSSIKHYGDNSYEYLQLIFPDLSGHFPGDKNYNYDQEIFGKILNF